MLSSIAGKTRMQGHLKLKRPPQVETLTIEMLQKRTRIVNVPQTLHEAAGAKTPSWWKMNQDDAMRGGGCGKRRSPITPEVRVPACETPASLDGAPGNNTCLRSINVLTWKNPLN